ncbi:hypothetical protein [Gloeothece verrucosa]|uniref:Uncharacterized protein n=1 Tax=Gloeothece verrucosa (strain PCC 7822) TaxID=497965 RepID=E0UBV8_GLOV7|nr:hypothetical protein [Gloeothece verrucosa]ADN15173.1 hypothetical protein Cyan7822_3221 [Gloeothece verrucosa PCC 7822]
MTDEVKKMVQNLLAQKAGNKELPISLPRETYAQLEFISQKVGISETDFATQLIISALKDAEGVIKSFAGSDYSLYSSISSDSSSFDQVSQLRQKVGRQPISNLEVTMLNGRLIKNRKAVDTFLEVITALGIEKVKALGIKHRNWDLVSTQKHPNDNYQQHPVGRYWVMTTSTTQEKKEILEQIARGLGKEILIKIV